MRVRSLLFQVGQALEAQCLLRPIHSQIQSLLTTAFTAGIVLDKPDGEHYCTINDTRLIGKSILNSTLFLLGLTKRWMKPSTFTANVSANVGAPWEVFRAPVNDKPTWMYIKQGAIDLYQCTLALLCDYSVGFTVSTADDFNANTIHSDIVPEILSAAL